MILSRYILYMAIVLDLVLWFRKVIGLMINIWYDTIRNRVCIKCRVENNWIFSWKSYSFYFMNLEIQHKNIPLCSIFPHTKDKISKKKILPFLSYFYQTTKNRESTNVINTLVYNKAIGLGSSHSYLSHILIEYLSEK